MIQKAKWIAPAGGEAYKPCHFRAEKEIVFDKVPSELTVQITCDGNYLFEVNGKCVGRGPSRPSRFVAFYDEYDVAALLHEGKNLFSVLNVCMNYPAESTYPITPALRMAIGDTALSDESWQTYICDKEWPSDGPFYTSQSGYAEWQDLNYSPRNYRQEPAKTVIVPASSDLNKKEIRKRDVPMPVETEQLPADIPAAAYVPACDLTRKDFAQLTTYDEHLPMPGAVQAAVYEIISGGEADVVLQPAPDNGGITFVVDFDKEISGRSEITLSASSGTIIDIGYEEELYNGDRLQLDKTYCNPTYNFCDRYILADGRQTVGNQLVERGFRQIQITLRNMTGPVTIHKVRAIDCRYPFAPRGSFFCGDYQLNRLWEVAKETISACTTDMFTDCPWRERLFYCNDLVVENRSSLQLFGDSRIHRRALKMLFTQMRPDSLFTSICPSISSDSKEGSIDFAVILSGNLTLPLVVWDYYLHTGDIEVVRDAYKPLYNLHKRFLSWADKDGILQPPGKYWNFIDWSYELNGITFSGKETALLNFLYIISAKAMLRLADAAGEEAVISETEIKRILDNSVEKFYRAEKGYFANATENCLASDEVLVRLGVPVEKFAPIESSRLVHAFAFLAGAEKEKCLPMCDTSLITPELYYCFFLLDAMESLALYDDALKLIRTYWGKMLDSGTPTLWENGVYKVGKSGFGGAASLCHGFSSSPVAFLQRAILGVAPLEPGFARFSFSPKVSEVGFARGRVPTPRGSIRAEWEAKNGKLVAVLTVPADCVAVTPAGEYTAGTYDLEWEI